MPDAEKDASEVMVWHDEADRLAVWGTLDPPAACMCRDFLPPTTCSHGEPEGECASCAACAACRGECGVCPYVLPPGKGR
jgi:hypothetical protein